MSKLAKPALISILICLAMIYSYLVPVTKIQSPDILSHLKIASETQYWQSHDVSGDIDIKDARYRFQSRVIARQYMNDLGEGLLLLIVDAGNFHHPRNCFLASGFDVKTLDDVEMKAAGRSFKAHVLFMQKSKESALVVYWMCVDKKVVGWTEQKFKQLFYSLFMKEKIGLMGRLDIPVRGNDTATAIKLAQDFIRSIGKDIPPDQADYLFGEKSTPALR